MTQHDLPIPAGRPPLTRPARRALAGPLLLYALFGGFFMLPFASTRVVESPAGDLQAHLSGVMEARNALREGQFPVRVAPRQLDGIRFPFFQFYGNFPYTAAALLTFLPGVNPYTGWKLVTFLGVTAAGFYTYRCGLALTRQVWPSLIAGAVFVASPYLTTDIRARFAYAEAVSFCILPATLFYSWRAFASRRRAPGSILLGGVCWGLVALSHNITYLYASALVGLFFLSHLTFRPSKDLRRFARVGACYGLGVAMALWYVAAQLKVLPYIVIAGNTGTPLWSTTYVPLRVLLSPFVTLSPTAIGTPNLGLQIGWPILAATLLSVGILVLRARRRGLKWWLLARLVCALLLAVFIVWSPVDFWPWVPSLFYNVQFTYRVLMFVVLWGSIVTAVALARAYRGTGGMSYRAGWVCLALIGLAAAPHVNWRHARLNRGALRAIMERPDVGPQAQIYYRPRIESMSQSSVTAPPGVPVLRAAETVQAIKHGRTTVYSTTTTSPVVAQLPVLFYPGLLEVTQDRQRVDHGHIDGLVALSLPPGRHVVRVRFVGVRWANVGSAVAWIGAVAVGGFVLLKRLRRRRVQVLRRDSVFPPRAAAFGFVLLALPQTLSIAWVPISRFLHRRQIGTVTASSESSPLMSAANAFDGDEHTAWSALGSGPAVLTVTPPSPRRVGRVVLEPRETMLLEGWHKVGVVLYLGGREVGGQTFVLPNAPSQPVQALRLDQPATADRIEFHFDDPVTVTSTGDRVFDPSVVNPGYREIRLYSD